MKRVSPQRFDRLEDRARQAKEDRKAPRPPILDRQAEYAAAYFAAAATDPRIVRDLPHPAAEPSGSELEDALAYLRKLSGGLRTVPKRDIRS